MKRKLIEIEHRKDQSIYMRVEHPRGLFEMLLSTARQSAEQMTKYLQELDAVQDADIKEALEAGGFISDKILKTLDQCFKLIGAEPAKHSERVQEVFVEEFRLQLADIRSPTARRLFVLAKTNQLLHLRIGEYIPLIACAGMSGHSGVSLLLGICLADNVAFIDTTNRLIGNIAEGDGAAALTVERKPNGNTWKDPGNRSMKH
jgi:ferritin-like metal-binding protein YciE